MYNISKDNLGTHIKPTAQQK